MRKTFFEYYSLSDSDIIGLWENCLLVMDTNILLNLYRYTPSTRDDLLGVLRANAEKLWLPYQVGWEFHNNRESVIKSAYYLTDIVNTDINRRTDDFLKSFHDNYIRNPFLSYDSIEKKVKKQRDALIKYVTDKFIDAPKLLEEDVILNDLNAFYDGRVGEGFNEEELKQIYIEGAQRYASKVPPGYKDESEKKNRGQRHLYGDLIIWKEIIRKAKASAKDIIFVSDDLKEDWLRIDLGQIKGPRRELLREFRVASNGQDIVIMTQHRFLEFIHSLPEHPVKSSTRKEVEASKDGNAFEYLASIKDGAPLVDKYEYKNLAVLWELLNSRIREQQKTLLYEIPSSDINGIEPSSASLETPGGDDISKDGDEGEDYSADEVR